MRIDGRVSAACGVVEECVRPVCCVAVACGVLLECLKPAGCVASASGVVCKCFPPDGCVLNARGVVSECVHPVGCVVDACGVVLQCVNPHWQCFECPVVLAFKAPEPNAVFVDIAPAPLPTRTPDRVASVVEDIAPVIAIQPESNAIILETPSHYILVLTV